MRRYFKAVFRAVILLVFCIQTVFYALPSYSFSSVSSGLKSCAANPACAATLAHQTAARSALTTAARSSLSSNLAASSSVVNFTGKNAIGAFTRTGTVSTPSLVDAGGKILLFGGLAHFFGLKQQDAESLRETALQRFNASNGSGDWSDFSFNRTINANSVDVAYTIPSSYSLVSIQSHSGSLPTTYKFENCSSEPISDSNNGWQYGYTATFSSSSGSFSLLLLRTNYQSTIDSTSIQFNSVSPSSVCLQNDREWDDLTESEKQAAIDLLTDDELKDALSFTTLDGVPDLNETIEFDKPLYDENGNPIPYWTLSQDNGDQEIPDDQDVTVTTTTTENPDGTTEQTSTSNRSCTSRYKSTQPFTSTFTNTIATKFPFDFLGDLYFEQPEYCITLSLKGYTESFCGLTQLISAFIWVVVLVAIYNLAARIA